MIATKELERHAEALAALPLRSRRRRVPLAMALEAEL